MKTEQLNYMEFKINLFPKITRFGLLWEVETTCEEDYEPYEVYRNKQDAINEAKLHIDKWYLLEEVQ